jgi:uncharacterized protein (DUF3084 family)
MNILARHYQRSQELRQVNAQITSYQTALKELFVRRAQLNSQLIELEAIANEVQAAEQQAAQLAPAES